MKIILEKSKCIGCNTCIALCPRYFEAAQEGKARLKKSKVNQEAGNEEIEVSELGCAKEAAGACPAECIRIVS